MKRKIRLFRSAVRRRLRKLGGDALCMVGLHRFPILDFEEYNRAQCAHCKRWFLLN